MSNLSEKAGGRREIQRPNNEPLPEFAYRELRNAILDGAFAPGEMLRQDEVASRLGVSRSPLREAMPRLEAEGIVVLKPRRGYAVASMEAEDVIEVFELRCLIETDLAVRAAGQRTDEDVATVRGTVERMSLIAGAADDADYSQWFELNQRFHEELLRPARRPYHERALYNCRGLIEAYIRMEVRFTGDLSEAQGEHAEMVDALTAGDGERLARLVREHCIHTRDRLLKGLAGRFRPRDGGSERSSRLWR